MADSSRHHNHGDDTRKTSCEYCLKRQKHHQEFLQVVNTPKPKKFVGQQGLPHSQHTSLSKIRDAEQYIQYQQQAKPLQHPFLIAKKHQNKYAVRRDNLVNLGIGGLSGRSMSTIGGGQGFHDKKIPTTAALPLSARKKIKARKYRRGRSGNSPFGGNTAKGKINQSSAENLEDDDENIDIVDMKVPVPFLVHQDSNQSSNVMISEPKAAPAVPNPKTNNEGEYMVLISQQDEEQKDIFEQSSKEDSRLDWKPIKNAIDMQQPKAMRIQNIQIQQSSNNKKTSILKKSPTQRESFMPTQADWERKKYMIYSSKDTSDIFPQSSYNSYQKGLIGQTQRQSKDITLRQSENGSNQLNQSFQSYPYQSGNKSMGVGNSSGGVTSSAKNGQETIQVNQMFIPEIDKSKNSGDSFGGSNNNSKAQNSPSNAYNQNDNNQLTQVYEETTQYDNSTSNMNSARHPPNSQGWNRVPNQQAYLDQKPARLSPTGLYRHETSQAQAGYASAFDKSRDGQTIDQVDSHRSIQFNLPKIAQEYTNYHGQPLDQYGQRQHEMQTLQVDSDNQMAYNLPLYKKKKKSKHSSKVNLNSARSIEKIKKSSKNKNRGRSYQVVSSHEQQKEFLSLQSQMNTIYKQPVFSVARLKQMGIDQYTGKKKASSQRKMKLTQGQQAYLKAHQQLQSHPYYGMNSLVRARGEGEELVQMPLFQYKDSSYANKPRTDSTDYGFNTVQQVNEDDSYQLDLPEAKDSYPVKSMNPYNSAYQLPAIASSGALGQIEIRSKRSNRREQDAQTVDSSQQKEKEKFTEQRKSSLPMIGKVQSNKVINLGDIEQKAPPQEYGLVSLNSYGDIDNNSQQNGSRIEGQQQPTADKGFSSPLSTMDKIELPSPSEQYNEEIDTQENKDLVSGVINIENQGNYKFNSSQMIKRNTITTDPDSNREVAIPDEDMNELASDYIAKQEVEKQEQIQLEKKLAKEARELELKRQLEEQKLYEEYLERRIEEKKRIIAESQTFIRNIIKDGYVYNGFCWNPDLMHEELKLSSDKTIIMNPDSQWRSVQGDTPMRYSKDKSSKFYVRFQVKFQDENKHQFKYFGLAKKFPKSQINKGNSKNREGIYFGSGQNDSKDATQSQGLYYYVNGQEIQISDNQVLRSGDIIGLRFDAKKGAVYFDINNKNFGVAYQGKELTKGDFYPTVDLGIAGDSVKVLQPPKKLIDDVAWREIENFVSKDVMNCLKKVENMNKRMENLFEVENYNKALLQQNLFQILATNILNDKQGAQSQHNLAKILESLSEKEEEKKDQIAEKGDQKIQMTQLLYTFQASQNQMKDYIDKNQLIFEIACIQAQVQQLTVGQKMENQGVFYSSLSHTLLEKIIQYPSSPAESIDIVDQLHMKLFEIQNDLTSMDYINFQQIKSVLNPNDDRQFYLLPRAQTAEECLKIIQDFLASCQVAVSDIKRLEPLIEEDNKNNLSGFMQFVKQLEQ